MKAVIYPESENKQRVTVGGLVVGYVRRVPGGWAASTLTGDYISHDDGIVDAVRDVVAFSYPQILIEVVEEEL